MRFTALQDAPLLPESATVPWLILVVVLDECAYEGNFNALWGGITARELVRRFWEATARGGYMGHRETYQGGKHLVEPWRYPAGGKPCPPPLFAAGHGALPGHPPDQ